MARAVPLVALLLVGSQTALGQFVGDDVERSQIAERRSLAESRFQKQRWDCSRRFLVTACMEDARAEYRAEIEALDRREAEMDSRLRHQRAQLRLEIIRQKTEALARLAPLPAGDRAPEAVPSLPDRLRQTRSGTAGPATAGETQAAAAERSARARVEAAQRRRDEAERRRLEREERQRSEQKQPAAGLPERPPIPLPKD